MIQTCHPCSIQCLPWAFLYQNNPMSQHHGFTPWKCALISQLTKRATKIKHQTMGSLWHWIRWGVGTRNSVHSTSSTKVESRFDCMTNRANELRQLIDEWDVGQWRWDGSTARLQRLTVWVTPWSGAEESQCMKNRRWNATNNEQT